MSKEKGFYIEFANGQRIECKKSEGITLIPTGKISVHPDGAVCEEVKVKFHKK